MQNGGVRDGESLVSGELECLLQALPPPLSGADFQALIEIAKTREGRSELSSANPLPSLLALVRFLLFHPCLDILVPALKLVRNLCAGDTLCQDSFVASGGPEVVAVAVGCSERTDVVRFALEASANVASAGENHRSALWSALFPGGFVKGLCSFADPKVADPLCRVLHACVSEDNGRLMELCGLEGLPIMACLIRRSSKSDGIEAEWLQLLLQKICLEESCFFQLFMGLALRDVYDDQESNSSGGACTSEQASLLRAISDGLNQQGSILVISKAVALSVFNIFQSAAEFVRDSSKRETTLRTGLPVIDVLRHSLTILRDICSLEDPNELPPESSVLSVEDLQGKDSSTFGSLLSAGLVHFMLSLLRDLGEPAIIRKARVQSRLVGLDSAEDSDGQAASQASEDGVSRSCGQGESAPLRPQVLCPYKGFRRDLVSVIGNSGYRRKLVQDEIRRQKGLLLLLQQCVVDEDNPFLREWGIWTMRNLLEGNVENQREVAELKIQGSVDTREISGLGLQVKIDPDSGRAKLVNVNVESNIPIDH